MNNDAFINHLANITGQSRKQVLALLKRLSSSPELLEEFRKDMKKNKEK